MRAALAIKPIRVNVYYSAKAQSYWANSPDLDGLAASSDSREGIEVEVRWAAEALLDLQGWEGPQPQLEFQDAVFDSE